MNYEEWNNKIASEFFRTENEGKRAFLCVDEDLIEKIGGSGAVADFVNAVKQGPNVHLRYAQGICSTIKALKNDWREKGAQGMPPYIATLALFVLAASYENSSGSDGYHKRLNELLGEPAEGTPIAGFYKYVLEVWDDLEKWTNVDCDGRLGLFRVEFSGKWIYVAIPQSQTLLTEKERDALPEIFSKAGLDPEIEISDEELARAIIQYGRGKILKRTLLRVEGRGDIGAEFRQLLLEEIQEELADWKEVGPRTDADKKLPTRAVRILINLRILPISNAIETGLRFSTGNLFSEASFSIRGERSGVIVECETSEGGWSQPLMSGGKIFSASELDWKRGEKFGSQIDGAQFVFPGSNVRIFQDGNLFNVTHLIERAKLPARGGFWIAIANDAPKVMEWGTTHCPGWLEVPVQTGLPRGWRLFKADSVASTRDIEQLYPSLSLPLFARLTLVGGLKLGRSNRYLDIAPPRIKVEVPSGTFHLDVNGERLEIESDETTFPVKLLREHNLIELHNLENPDKSRKCSFYITSSASLSWRCDLAFGLSNGIGESENPTTNDAAFSGAIVNAKDLPSYPVRHAIETDRVVVLGRCPGEIVEGSSSENVSWTPVWIINKGRKNRKVTFCGISIDQSRPSSNGQLSGKEWKKWREIFYVGRRNLRPPTHRRLAALWKEYVEAAKNA